VPSGPEVPGHEGHSVLDPTEGKHEDVLAFAYSLMEQGDYYRAITEFKRFGFLEPQSPDTFPAYLSIGRAYELGGKPADAATWLQHLEPMAGTPQLHADLLVEVAFAHYLAGASPIAAEDLRMFLENPQQSGTASHETKERAYYLMGWAYLTSNEVDHAADAFSHLDLPYAHQLAEDAQAHAHLPSKSPVLAGVLSALLPGLGHVYLGQPAIGAAAFGWNALFGFATYDALHHKLWGVGAVLGGLELLWYGGAVFGAISGAFKYNRDAELNHLDELKHKYDPAPPSWPPSGGTPIAPGS
jgi:tetratricopeptide (TPR) repeat protein